MTFLDHTTRTWRTAAPLPSGRRSSASRWRRHGRLGRRLHHRTRPGCPADLDHGLTLPSRHLVAPAGTTSIGRPSAKAEEYGLAIAGVHGRVSREPEATNRPTTRPRPGDRARLARTRQDATSCGTPCQGATAPSDDTWHDPPAHATMGPVSQAAGAVAMEHHPGPGPTTRRTRRTLALEAHQPCTLRVHLVSTQARRFAAQGELTTRDDQAGNRQARGPRPTLHQRSPAGRHPKHRVPV